MKESKKIVSNYCKNKNLDSGINYIAKIETKQGIANINEIIDESDAILIDRGDLSRELSISKIPGATDALNQLCQQKGIPFYVATNILESMMNENLPSRSEISDLFRMLASNVQGIVLAAEVAIGKNPIDSVKTVKYVSKVVELHNYGLSSFINEDYLKKDLPVHLRYWL